MYLCTKTCPVLRRGITTETYLMVSVDKNTLHLPVKIEEIVENKSQILTNIHIQSKTKFNLKVSIAVKGQKHTNLSKLKQMKIYIELK